MRSQPSFKLLVVLVFSIVLLVFLNAAAPLSANAQGAATVAPTSAVTFDLKVTVKDFVAKLPDGFYGIKPEDALKAMGGTPKPFLVDLRDDKDFGDGGYIVDAVNIPLPVLTKNLDKLPVKDQRIIVYCGIGHRGGMALMTLRLLGYTNVQSITGGYTAWKAASLPVTTGKPPVASTSSGTKVTVDADLFAVLDKYLTSLPADYYGLPPTEALKALSKDPKPFLLDVREPSELTANGYIDGSVNVPLRTLFDHLDKLPQDVKTPIIDYCAVGHRGSMAMMALRLYGFTDVRSISGGFNNWVKAGLPIIKPSSDTIVVTATATPKL